MSALKDDKLDPAVEYKTQNRMVGYLISIADDADLSLTGKYLYPQMG